MRTATIPIPELAILAGTRGMAGVGAGFLLGSRIPAIRRRRLGWTLLTIGALSTIPLAMDILKNRTDPTRFN
jgi:hypothetical protein